MATILSTARLTLIPTSLELIRAALDSNDAVERLLGVRVPEDWPGTDYGELLPLLVKQFEENPERAEWSWQIIHTADGTLIGSLGFKDIPDQSGTVELGYGIIPDYRKRGYTFEAARAVVNWALQQPEVRRITAGCEADNIGSIRILEKLGMRSVGREGALLKWELKREG